MTKKHLPLYGVGPVYGFIVIFTTILSIYLSESNKISSLYVKPLKIAFIIIGILLIVLALYLWIKAVFIDKIDNSIKNNQLNTKGIYSVVRNPIYSAILFINTGIIIINQNIYLFILPFIYYLYLTVLMKYTEEKWLYNLFGKKYDNYCKQVNRCIPIKKRKE